MPRKGESKMREFMMANYETMTVKELAIASGKTERRIRIICHYLKITPKEDNGTTTHVQKFFNVYERENWVI
jgi:hypothetical protein